MRKYTQKALKMLVKDGVALDLTNYSHENMWDFMKDKALDKVGYSSGIYGINGGLLKDTKTGTLYAITARNCALFTAF